MMKKTGMMILVGAAFAASTALAGGGKLIYDAERIPRFNVPQMAVPPTIDGTIDPAEMFKEFVVPSLRGQCQALDYAYYYLDGTSALQHLDALLAIEEIDDLRISKL